MSIITGLTRGGVQWTPSFIMAINQTICIGCGRCYKVCPRDVFELIDREDLELDDLDDDAFDDAPGMVMNIRDLMDCIGCEACSRTCPKNCLSHAPQALAA